ncbi:YdcF family protein [Paenibacillus motobuensis]|uniref:YdcF family protein n=1 Tax=Paenibacillus TaxID=44249 RepID=UPI00203D6358|nr:MULTISPECIES: YdcF family protein [Paenibacillus]MCM3039195.1 YdcF family protein [Paenibacillus lutimineralis]MCM3646299.1 YdcF family protein [Paenibacillus motobuensis]
MAQYRTSSPYVGNRRRSKRKFVWVLRIGLTCILIGILWSVYALAQIGSVYRNTAATTAASEPADVGIILGAAMWGDQPSPGLQERLEQGLAAYKAGRFHTFILTGGLDKPDYRYTEAEGMAIYLEQHGIPKEAILLENKATSTYENLKFSKAIMEEQGLTSAVIITHTFHGNRSYEIAKALDYPSPKLSLTETHVLKRVPTILREILAYTKWKIDSVLLAIGWK